MPNESTAAVPGPADPTPAGLAPADRARLTQCYNRAAQALEGKQPNFDYAIEMFSTCVLGDPANVVYLQGLLGVLKKKHGPRKSTGLSGLFAVGSRGSMRKAAAQAQWRDVLRQGVEILRPNPYDSGCLLSMAEACGNLMLHDTQRVYLKAALDATPADPDVNRQCAKFLANHGDFDQAIACWVRISSVRGLGEEAQREIARLQVEKTIASGQGMTGRPGKPGAAAAEAEAGAGAAGRIATLRQEITENPQNIEPYLELADLLEREATVAEAEAVLAKALALSGGDLKVREHVEDRQLRWARHKVMMAEKRLAGADTPEHHALVERLKSEQLKREIDVYGARCARYPENVIWKYELAMRLKAAGNHTEAIKHFQEVLQDPRRKGAVSLEVGECFQKIKQYQLAMRNYEAAVESLSDRELELRKRALYRAGVLAAGLDDADGARKYLSALAGLDFNYRDVAQRLDKLSRPRDNDGAGAASG
jgi:tetratricopeptide (TPR) repeat protein